MADAAHEPDELPRQAVRPVCAWSPSAAFTPLCNPAGAPSESCEVAIRCRHLPGGAQCNPVALLLDVSSSSVLLGRTEWRQKTDAPVFSALICFDAATLSRGTATTLELQIRHVEEPFWDQREADEVAALHAMPLLGRAPFRFSAALEAPYRQLGLRLASGPAVETDPEFPATAELRVRSAAGWPGNRLVAGHSSVNYRFRCTGASAGLAPAAAAPNAAVPTALGGHGVPHGGLLHGPARRFGVSTHVPRRELRVCEHLFQCGYGYTVPRAVLAMLAADAEVQATASPVAGALGNGGLGYGALDKGALGTGALGVGALGNREMRQGALGNGALGYGALGNGRMPGKAAPGKAGVGAAGGEGDASDGGGAGSGGGPGHGNRGASDGGGWGGCVGGGGGDGEEGCSCDPLAKFDFSADALGRGCATRANANSAPAARPKASLGDEYGDSWPADPWLADPYPLLCAALTPLGWASLADWCRQSLHALEAQGDESGFKTSVAKKEEEAAPVPVNLQVNVLEVRPDPPPAAAGGEALTSCGAVAAPSGAACIETAGGVGDAPSRGGGPASARPFSGPAPLELGAVWPTVTLGAPATHSVGFKDGGATGVARKLGVLLSSRELMDRRAAVELGASFGRRCALLLCHGMSALAACFALSCRSHLERRSPRFFSSLGEIGFLCQLESLLSTRGDEWGMLQDTQAVVGMLGRVHVVLLSSDEEAPAGVSVRGGVHTPTLCFAPRELGFRDAAHASAEGLVAGVLVRVHPVLFTQGINEEQSMANLMHTHTAEQAEINEHGLRQLHTFQAAFEAFAHRREADLARAGGDGDASQSSSRSADAEGSGSKGRGAEGGGAERGGVKGECAEGGNAEGGRAHLSDGIAGAEPRPESSEPRLPVSTVALLDRQRRLLAKARRLLLDPPDAKNVQLLHVAAALTRLMDGGRVTVCKSGKDRTAMSLTLEHALLLQREHGLGEAGTADALATMRRHGVRRENVRQNTSRRVFAFNWVQQKMLPDAYRPPDGSAKGAAA